MWFVYTNAPTEKQAKVWNPRVAIKSVKRGFNRKAQQWWLIRQDQPVKAFMKKLKDKNKGRGMKVYAKKVTEIPAGWN